MAEYGLKYTATRRYENGDEVMLRVSVKGWTGRVYTLPTLSGLTLDIEGSQGGMTAPLVKTSAHFALVDAFDEGTMQTDGTECVKDGGKWGRFEEFYTPDATRHKVEIVGPLGVIWTGFITPDSWAEDMTYHGVVNITARDMVGFLDELPFDLTGKVSAEDILRAADERIGAEAMQMTFIDGVTLYNDASNRALELCKFDASTFAGDSFYAALEKTLEALGLVLRYNGNNALVCTSIRHLPDVTWGAAHTPVFVAHSGHRTLDPAVRQIVDIFKPTIKARAIADAPLDDFNATSLTLATAHPVTIGGSASTATFTIPRFYIHGNTARDDAGWYGDLATPSSAGTPAVLGDALSHTMLVACDVTTDGARLFCVHEVGNAMLDFTIGVDELLQRSVTGVWSRVNTDAHRVAGVDVMVRYALNGGYRWLGDDGSWTSVSAQTLTLTPGTPLRIPGVPYDVGTGTIPPIEIVVVKVATENTAAVTLPLYAGLSFTASRENTTDAPAEVKTTTIYSEDNRVEVKRTPAVGACRVGDVSSDDAPNVIAFTDSWYWDGDEDATRLPLAVWIALQILTSRIQQNGASVFTGEFIDSDGTPALPGYNYVYYGRKCILTAGTFDFITGRVTGAILREYADWDDVWAGGGYPAYTRTTIGRNGGDGTAGGDTTGGGNGDFGDDFNSDFYRYPRGMYPIDED